MSESLFHTELRKYFRLLTGVSASADGDGWDELVEEVDNAYAALPPGRDDIGIRFSKVRGKYEAVEEEISIDGLHDSASERDDIKSLASEVERKIRELVREGFPIETIESWLQDAVKLSPVVITADHRIYLTDYSLEIQMRQLPKALFLFFLKHPEGCRLKDLSDHREELLAIYRKLTISDDQAQVEASIDALVNAQGNSFSEKCAAVKLAFQRSLPKSIAKNYYIQGPQGGVKGISLDRKLVEWEE